jgi:hypothetical protein
MIVHLDVHFDHGFADESGAEEGPEGDQKVPAGDAGEIEQRIRNLSKTHPSFVRAHSFGIHPMLCFRKIGNLDSQTV